MKEKKKIVQKEHTINTGTFFKAKYGTFDKNNPRVLYLHVKAKVKPLNKKTTYASDIKLVKEQFDQYVQNYFKDSLKYSDKFIYSCDVSENNISFGKKSNLKYEVLVKPVESKKFDEYADDMVELSNLFSNKLNDIMKEGYFEVC